jgi:hypothetical protein
MTVTIDGLVFECSNGSRPRVLPWGVVETRAVCLHAQRSNLVTSMIDSPDPTAWRVAQ